MFLKKIIKIVLNYQRNYWLSGQKPVGLAICRIFIYSALLHPLSESFGWFPSLSTVNSIVSFHDPLLWTQTGFGLLFSQQPSAFIIWIIFIIAEVTTITSILGLFTRSSLIIATLSSLMIAGITYGWDSFAGHRFNITYLVPLAFMFANAGQMISVDSLLRKKFNWGQNNNKSAAEWPILLAQASVSLFLFAAFYAKLGFLSLTPTLNWILSDSLRNCIAFPYSVRGYDISPWLLQVISHPIAWKTSAFIQMLMQGTPITTLFTKNPIVRLLEAIIFIVGGLLLYLVMTLGNWPWCLLAAVFIDWDYWIERIRPGILKGIKESKRVGILAKAYITSYILFFILISFTPYIYGDFFNKKFYPFFPMDFFSVVWHRPPVNIFEHKAWNYFTDDVYAYRSNGQQLDYQGWFHGVYNYATSQQYTIDERAAHVKELFKNVSRNIYYPYCKMNNPDLPSRDFEGVEPYPNTDIKEIQAYAAIYTIPSYPNHPLKRERIVRGLIGIYDVPTDQVKVAHGTVSSSNDDFILKIEVQGFKEYKLELLYSEDPLTADSPLPLKLLKPIPMGDHQYRIVKTDRSPWYIFIKIIDTSDQKEYIFWGASLF